MPTEQTPAKPAAAGTEETRPRENRPVSAAAQRALAEAAARRAERARHAPDQAKEVGGRDGPEPTRYGDWEKDGLTSDF